MSLHLRFGVALLLLGVTAGFLQGHSRQEIIVPRQNLESLPAHFGSWNGTDLTIPDDVLKVLGSGDFLARVYRDPAAAPPVELFMAYFPTQRFGSTIHSPKHCLPGSGWRPLESHTIMLTRPGQGQFPANRYLIAKGGERQLVLYWYWSHDRGVASEYWAKFYLLMDSMRLNRSDGSLVRLVTPIGRGENAASAEQRLVSFADNIVPVIDTYVPQ